MTTSFDPALFTRLLRAEGCRFGDPLEYQLECASTNDEAKRAIARGAPSGATFIAEVQTAGRGRRGRSWYSPAGQNLTFTVVVRPRLSADRLSALTLATGLGVREALAPLVERPLGIKWPNDVLCDGKKLAGILVEGETSSSPLGLAVGVGINVGARSFPAELAGSATSLALLGRGAALEPLLVAVLRGMDRWIGVLEAGELEAISAELARHDALRGRTVRVDANVGRAVGIDAEGRLLLETEDGLLEVNSGTVEIQ